jgi:hypothetical protein
MRMIHYFGGLALTAALLLLASAWTGLTGSPHHLAVGLAGSIATVAAHSLLILFMIVSGRILREAMRARSLDGAFLGELNRFFERRAAYPAALFAVLLTAAAAVLGYGQHAFGMPPWVHPLAGALALVLNLFSFSIETRALAENQRLMDKASSELDRIDRELALRQMPEPLAEGDPLRSLVRLGWTIGLGAWLPYLYQLLIVWKGRASRVGLHPWIEISALGFLILLLTWRERMRSARPRRDQPGGRP